MTIQVEPVESILRVFTSGRWTAKDVFAAYKAVKDAGVEVFSGPQG